MKHGFLKNKIFRTNNEGFSLVELIVVMAIMGVMVGVASLGVSMMFSRDAESVAKVIDDELSEVRMMCMSKPGVHTLLLHCDSNGKKTSVTALPGGGEGYAGNYILIQSNVTDLSGNSVTSEKLVRLDKDAELIYYAEGDSEPTSPSDTTFQVTFDKANGSVRTLSCNSVEVVDKDMYYIKCKAKNKEKTITIMDVTGRHIME